jgi:hypothetical protein
VNELHNMKNQRLLLLFNQRSADGALQQLL